MSSLLQDIRFALRSLRRSWVVTAIAVLSLALAIGGNTAVFSLLDAFLFRPLPYAEPERVVLFGERSKDQPVGSGFTTSPATYIDLTERSRTIAEWSAVQFRTFSLRNGNRSDPVTGLAVTPGFFDVMRVRPARGRAFRPEEGMEGGPRVVMVSAALQARTWGEERAGIGEILVVDGEPHEVIGILPPDISFLGSNQDLWTALAMSPADSTRGQQNTVPVGRMASGATMEQVVRETSAIAAQLEAEHPAELRNRTLDSNNLRHDIPNRQTRLFYSLLQGLVMLVLLIACVNITNLLLARGQTRAREIAVRTIMGAGQWRIVRLLLTESALMVAAALILGLAIGQVGIRVISTRFSSALPAQWQIQLDGRVLAFTVAVSALAGLLFGVLPAMQTLRRGQAATLREGARGGVGRERRRVTSALVVAELALSFVALGGGSLLMRSFLDLRANDPGLDTAHVLTAGVRLPPSKIDEDAERTAFAELAVERMRGIPGVEDVALTSALPLAAGAASDTFRTSTTIADEQAPSATVVHVTPGYAATFAIPVLQGRFFGDGDRAGAAPVAVISRTLAESQFAGGSALGESIRIQGEARQIVGIVADVRQSLFQTGTGNTGTVYLPIAQSARRASAIAIRTAGDPAALKDPLRRAAEELDPDLTVSRLLTMDEYIAQTFVGLNVFNTILGGFGIMALLLASIGTYGVLAYSVAQRRRELGVRMAIGAKPSAVVRLVAGQGLRLGVIGLGIGALLTLPLVGVLNGLLQGLSTVRPFTLVFIGAILFGTTLLASWLPASRASRIDPVRTLREE